jgi:hypothetical protein
MVICLIMVKVKSSSDILQGLSKLDHLLKVSAFQVHKSVQIEAQKSGFDSCLEVGSEDKLVMHIEREIIRSSVRQFHTEKRP